MPGAATMKLGPLCDLGGGFRGGEARKRRGNRALSDDRSNLYTRRPRVSENETEMRSRWEGYRAF